MSLGTPAVPLLGAKPSRLPRRPPLAAPDPSYLDLGGNEWPEPPPRVVREAMAQALERANRYPDPGANGLRNRLSEIHGLAPERIAVGNGSCELLFALGEALLDPSSEVVYAWPSFSLYRHLAPASGARAVEVPLDDSGRHDLDALRVAVTDRTRLLLVCNPNNPTGTAWPLEAVVELLDNVPPTTCVALDEAYIEFDPHARPDETTARLLARFPNLVVLRTFSKFYSLAGLRVGYGLFAHEPLRAATDSVRQIYTCNAVAQAGACAALDETTEYRLRVTRAAELRETLIEGLRLLGLAPADSRANLVWVPLGSPEAEQRIVTGLREREVLVRPGSSIGADPGMRITLALRPEIERLLQDLEAIVSRNS